MKNQIIITADDFGISQENNLAILEAFKNGVLTSTCLMSNGEAFMHAICEVLPQTPDIDLGIHLNVIEGQSQKVTLQKTTLTNEQGFYYNGFLQMLLKSHNKRFLKEIEEDFRIQIETIKSKVKVQFINSHVHVHAIPKIFELTCKLADEYDIPFIRTQFEAPYLVPNLKKHLTLKYPLNLIKLVILNTFTHINKQTLEKYKVKTNDNFIGVTYTGYMDVDTIKYGIEKLKNEDGLLEIILHPTLNQEKTDNYNEYLSLLDEDLKSYLKANLTSFKQL